MTKTPGNDKGDDAMGKPVKSRNRSKREVIGGRPVVPALEDLMLEVTPEMIMRSMPRNQCYCVMATAARETLGNIVDVYVSYSRAYLVYENVVVRYEVAPSTADQIHAYDDTGAWVPGVYRLQKMRASTYGPPVAKGTPRAGIPNKKRSRTVPVPRGSLARNAWPIVKAEDT